MNKRIKKLLTNEKPSEFQAHMCEAGTLLRPKDSKVAGPFYPIVQTALPFVTIGRMKVFFGVEHKGRDGLWYHVSYTTFDGKKVPTHAQTCIVRKAMFRHDSVVVAVFPPVNEYVNEHVACLHLWERIDGPRLVPDLREIDPRGGLSI